MTSTDVDAKIAAAMADQRRFLFLTMANIAAAVGTLLAIVGAAVALLVSAWLVGAVLLVTALFFAQNYRATKSPPAA